MSIMASLAVVAGLNMPYHQPPIHHVIYNCQTPEFVEADGIRRGLSLVAAHSVQMERLRDKRLFQVWQIGQGEGLIVEFRSNINGMLCYYDEKRINN